MPLILLALLLANLATIAFFGLEIYLWREWYLHKDILADHDYARNCLIGAIAMLLYLLLGRSIIRMLLGKKRTGEDEPVANRFPDQQQLQRPDGSVIHIEYGGIKGKQTIVFIHGWNSNSMQWYYQKKYFGNDYHLVLMDHPGLGKSKRASNKDFSLEKLAADLDAVIDFSEAKDPILWGHSMGGMTILTFCKVYKQKLSSIKGIILEHTTFTNPVKTAILSSLLVTIQNSVLKPICWLMVLFSPLLWVSRWMSYLNGNMLVMTRFLTFAGTQTGKQLDFTSYLSAMAPPAVTGRGLLAMFDYDATDVLPELFVPTLIIGANKDRLTKLEASIIMKERIPGAKLLTLQPAGHMGFVERHQEVNEAVSQFILQTRLVS
ncbi:alpha/beta fold hydrolase [Dyadobacter sediminis]|uniref:Alpha/beta hydrolase n=1 Tax=Dyadobacter sediminis TaxID=1493691 RepID=A0A5R9KK00_9BACT|nr:alpha/beta hydrolase [Dyadobacter sediminis]TLU96396.1 alpha/beta hydrolase [Dyadobacter sediminis]GGB81904.1 alpha/beta hydrolase [Dyadobacter sediminis]